MSLRAPIVAACIAVTAFSACAADVLTVAQVEKVTGLSGLKTKPSKYDKGGTSFVTAGDDLAVAVKNQSAAVYEVWKSHPSFEDQKTLAGVGDDAIVSGRGRYVCFKKAGKGICITGMYDMPGKPALVNDAQLVELARVAAAGL